MSHIRHLTGLVCGSGATSNLGRDCDALRRTCGGNPPWIGIRRNNVDRYCRLLETATDERRQTIVKLLAEERQKQTDAGDSLIEKSAEVVPDQKLI
jgi:hypothetical protein